MAEPTDTKTILAEALASLPALMAELMREFVARRDLASRTTVRLRMKALLDLASADTEYPANPLKPSAPAADNPYIVPNQPITFGATTPVAPVAGAAPVNNDDILG